MAIKNNQKITVSEIGAGKRLDTWLSQRFPSFSRNFWVKLIKNGAIEIIRNDIPAGKVRRSRILLENDIISINTCMIRGHEPEHDFTGIIKVLYEDDNLLAVRKPAGLLTHPAGLFGAGSLIDIIEEEYGSLYICGRLDRFTSGIIVLAKQKSGPALFDNGVEKHLISKEYLALVKGIPSPPSGTIREPIDHDQSSEILLKMTVSKSGKAAVTTYKTLRTENYEILGTKNYYSLLSCSIEAGKKHQIRVHLSHIGYPIFKDKLYDQKIDYDYFTPRRGNLHSYWPSWHGLHCYKITIPSAVFATKTDLVIKCEPFGEMVHKLDELNLFIK